MQRIVLFFILCVTYSAYNAQVALQTDSFAINYQTPQEFEIGGITVTGPQFLDKGIIATVSGLSVGDKVSIPGERISDAIENLWKQGLFDDIKITITKLVGNTVFLEISLVERPRLSKFTFKGIKKGEADDLREKIKLVKGKVITDHLIASTSAITKNFFIDKGFMDTEVTIRPEKDSLLSNSVTLYINIKKGGKYKVNKIIFHNATSFSKMKLKKALKETKEKVWYNPFNNGKYLEENLEKDLPGIITKYNTTGFRDAKILKDTVYKVPFRKKKRVNIEITLSEGKKFYFRNISWMGNTKYTAKELSNVLAIKKGDIFNQDLLSQKLNMNPNGIDVSSLYMDDGYLFFQITPVEINVENDSIDLEIRMYEGKQATINKVTVSGNTKTNDHVIMREIRTRPGMLFSRADIIRTTRELAQLGYFDPEKTVPNPIPNPANGTVDIDYAVEEKPNDQIELSGGWGNRSVVGTLGITFNNFSTKNFFKKEAWRPLPTGDGQRLSLRAQANGLPFQSYNMSFTEPWLGGKRPNSLSFSAYHTVQNSGILGSDGKNRAKSDWNFLKITGASVGLGNRLRKPDDYFVLYQELNYQYYQVNNFGSVIPSLSSGFANNISYRFSISRNSVDKPIFETRGSNISFSAQLTPPYSLFNKLDYSTATAQERFKFIEYQKYKFTAAWFTQLTNKKAAEGKEARNLVLYTKVGYGFLGMYNSKVGRSPFERFVVGGSGMTGFNGILGNEIVALRGYNDASISSAGGSPMVNRYTTELRFPISLNPQATIYCLAFAEAGNTWNSIQKYRPFELKRSAGLGVRIFLPMFGLIGFDYGWGFDYNPNDNYGSGRNIQTGKPQGQFHFTIGANMGEL
ncbi:MAG: outer membrane protein assembly factor BamA [Bacteroidetes bacterium]|nr:outer membrane protein assembly factor BamA [Bacteroidota bacterium]